MAPQEALAIPSVTAKLATQAAIGAPPNQTGPNRVQILVFYALPAFFFILASVVLLLLWKCRPVRAT